MVIRPGMQPNSAEEGRPERQPGRRRQGGSRTALTPSHAEVVEGRTGGATGGAARSPTTYDLGSAT